jgi:hypothetical protein
MGSGGSFFPNRYGLSPSSRPTGDCIRICVSCTNANPCYLNLVLIVDYLSRALHLYLPYEYLKFTEMRFSRIAKLELELC